MGVGLTTGGRCLLPWDGVHANRARGIWRDGLSAAMPEGCPSERSEGINTSAEANAALEVRAMLVDETKVETRILRGKFQAQA